MSKIYMALGVLIALIVYGGGAYYVGRTDGRSIEVANQTENKWLIEKTREEAKLGAADAIASIKINHTTVQAKMQREISTNTYYRDCVHTDNGLQLLNDALENRKRPADSGKLPKVDSSP